MTKSPKIIVVGLGRTGTTALFYKIREALPGNPVEYFEPTTAPVFDSEAEQRGVIVKALIGSMENWRSFAEYDHRFALVRDPRDRWISFLLYSVFHEPYCLDRTFVKRFIELLRKKEKNPRDVPLFAIAELYLRFWADYLQAKMNPAHFERIRSAIFAAVGPLPGAGRALALANLLQKHGFTRISYEDFVAGGGDTFKRLEEHLEVKVSATPAAVSELHRRVERTGSSGSWRHWFTPFDIEYYREPCEVLLKLFGYELDWSLAEKPKIPAAHASGYVEKLLAEVKSIRARGERVPSWLPEVDPKN